MRIAKPILLVSTPLGVAFGLVEGYRLAGGLVVLMAAMPGAIFVAGGHSRGHTEITPCLKNSRSS
ncbi:MAG TPA: hypothetical protein VIY90_16485 [Steroidobacteraceae bacterium]